MKWRCRGKLAVAKSLLELVERVFCHPLQFAIGVPFCHEPPCQVSSWITALYIRIHANHALGYHKKYPVSTITLRNPRI